MSCQYCQFDLFQEICWTDATIMCNKCAGEFVTDFDGVLLGKRGEEHVIKIHNPLTCPHCGFHITYGFYPCGGEWFFIVEKEKCKVPKKEGE